MEYFLRHRRGLGTHQWSRCMLMRLSTDLRSRPGWDQGQPGAQPYLMEQRCEETA
jgi:hypothetical protein